VRTGIVFRNLQGDPITLDYENIHHRDETLTGIAFFGLYESNKGYEAGNRYGLGAGMSYRGTGDRLWSLRAGVEAQQENAERWNGIVHRSDGNQGRKDLCLDTPGKIARAVEKLLEGP
jgi:hypothetical protein